MEPNILYLTDVASPFVPVAGWYAFDEAGLPIGPCATYAHAARALDEYIHDHLYPDLERQGLLSSPPATRTCPRCGKHTHLRITDQRDWQCVACGFSCVW